MKQDKLENIAKEIWVKYVDKYGVPDGLPNNPEEFDEWKGWIYFLVKNKHKLEEHKKRK